MAEEVKGNGAEAPMQETTHSEVEVKAMSMGWKPEDQWEGDPDQWVPAKEFVGRKSLFDKIEHQSKELKELRKSITDFRGHYEKVRETEYKRAMEDLKAQRKEALKNEDVKTVLEIDEEIETLESKKEEVVPKQTVQQGPSPGFQKWIAENQWYVTESKMARIADGIGMDYVQTHPSASEQEVFDFVTSEMRELYPTKLGGKKNVPQVDGGGNRQTSGKSGAVTKLPPEAEEVMNRLVKAGAMTREEYIRDWNAQQTKGER